MFLILVLVCLLSPWYKHNGWQGINGLLCLLHHHHHHRHYYHYHHHHHLRVILPKYSSYYELKIDPIHLTYFHGCTFLYVFFSRLQHVMKKSSLHRNPDVTSKTLRRRQNEKAHTTRYAVWGGETSVSDVKQNKTTTTTNKQVTLGQSIEKKKQVVNCWGFIFRSGRP